MTGGRHPGGRLAGRRALVTGAAQGIGEAIAEAMAAEGADVTLTDVRPDVVAVAARLRDQGWPAQAIVADLAAGDDIRALVDAAGDVDVLVNNAGTVRRTAPTDAWEAAVADFDAVVGLNLRGAYLVGRAAIPGIVRRGGGHVVNITTDHVHTCWWPDRTDHADAPGCPWRDERRPPGGGRAMDVYDASKWGLHGLTLSWASALQAYRVRVNSVSVGATDTPMLRSFLPGEPDAATVAGWLRPEQVAHVVLELLCEPQPGRSGDSIGVWPGHPTCLRAPGPNAITA